MLGRLVLNHNPNLLPSRAELPFVRRTSCQALVTNDPLLAGRIHSYVDADFPPQWSQLSPELPINAP
jgi:catalase